MISPIRFSALILNSPQGKTQVVEDNKTKRVLTYSNWVVDESSNPPRAYLKDRNHNIVGSYDVRKDGRNYVIDRLDPLGAQG